jgi:hypothetical protein
MKVDHEAVRQLAIQIGVRPAARKLGLNEDTVCTWATREDWFTPKPIVSKAHRTMQAMKARPGDALLQALQEDNTPTRAALSKAHRKAAEHAQKLTGRTLMDKEVAQALRQHGQGAALVHGWEAKQERDQSQVAVNIAILNA